MLRNQLSYRAKYIYMSKYTPLTSSFRRRLLLSGAALLTTTLAACGGSSNSDTGAAQESTQDSANGAAYQAASPFPSGSCLLWKPTSEIDHGLVVLVPAGMFGGGPVTILNENGDQFAQGREHVDARGHNQCNGVRYHFVFGRGPGSSFPNPSILSIGGKHYKVPNPAGRWE